MRLFSTLLIGGAVLAAAGMAMRQSRSNEPMRLIRRYGKMASKVVGRRMIRRLWTA